MVDSPDKNVEYDVTEIDLLDRKSWKVTSDLAIHSGSILKVSDLGYPQWGIGLNEDNRDRLKELAAEYYNKDGLQAMSVSQFTTTDFRRSHEEWMRNIIASVANRILCILALKKKNAVLNVLDIGAGEGSLTAAIFGKIFHSEASGVLPRIRWYLLDRSPEYLRIAKQKLNKLYGIRGDSLVDIGSDDENYLRTQNIRFDLVVSISHFHHKSFADWFSLLHERMSDDGFLFIGDWYSPLFHHPYGVYKLLLKLEASDELLAEFSRLFDIDTGREFFSRFNASEIDASERHMQHWINIYDSVVKMRRKGLEVPRIFFLEAHETSNQRKQKLQDAGFCVDWEAINKAFKSRHGVSLGSFTSRLIRNSDFARVLAATKMPFAIKTKKRR